MTLYHLRQRLHRELGLSRTNDNQVEVLDALINDAAYEIYTQTDEPRVLREMSFRLDTTDPLPRITLPGYIGEIRAMRRGFVPVTLHDMRPKYHTNPWPKDNLYTFRMLGETPLCRSIDNSLPFYMDPVDGPEDLEVTIVGKTADAHELHASFDKNGEGTAQTALWEEVYAITKNTTTAVDIILRLGTSDGDEMSRIYNYATQALYLELELRESPFDGACGCTTNSVPAGNCLCIEVLYKPVFRPLQTETASYQVTGYDNAIIYKAVEIYRLRGLGASATQDQINAALAHAKRADDVLKNSIQDKIQGEQLVINFGRSRADVRNLRGLRAYKYGNLYGPYTWGPLR